MDITTIVEQGKKGPLLASEQRSYDRMMREAEAIRSLQRDVEAVA
jgi:hypothetical protein